MPPSRHEPDDRQSPGPRELTRAGGRGRLRGGSRRGHGAQEVGLETARHAVQARDDEAAQVDGLLLDRRFDTTGRRRTEAAAGGGRST